MVSSGLHVGEIGSPSRSGVGTVITAMSIRDPVSVGRRMVLPVSAACLRPRS